MVKKDPNGRKSRGAAGIATIDEPVESTQTVAETGFSGREEVTTSKRERKSKVEQLSSDSVGVGDIRKAVAFVNSIGGLDRALAVLQILKVAKEVQ